MKHKRKKIVRKMMAVVLAAATAVSIMPAYVAKADDAYVARVSFKSLPDQEYKTIGEAWNAANSKNVSSTTITLLKDWNTEDYGRLVVQGGNNVTINLNGHIINRHRASTKTSASKTDGEVICVNTNATLIINGGDKNIVHDGYVESEDHVWYENSGSTSAQIKGGVIAGGYSTNGAGGIHMKKGASVTLNDVTVAGNKADEYWGDGYGGGVAMYDENSSLTLNNSKIMYNYAETSGGGVYANGGYNNITLNNGSKISNNKADKQYGGGVYLDDDHSKVILGENCKISGNEAKYGGGIYADDDYMTVKMADTAEISDNQAWFDGGAAYFNYSKVMVKGGKIKDNQTIDGGGGGIWLQHYSNPWSDDSVTLANTEYTGNKALNGCGGAIHSEQENVNISACTIKNNQASDTGGGVYIYNQKNTITSSIINNNTAKTNGGGVYVEGVEDLGLSGKVIITDNKLNNGTYCNLTLGTSGLIDAKLTGSPSSEAKVGITVKSGGERKLSKGAGHYVENVFFSDKELNGQAEQYVKWKDDRTLWMVTTKPEKAEVKTVDISAKETTSDKEIKGYFSYPSVEDTTKDLNGVFYYSDSYFKAPKTYNDQLATMSMCLAMSAFNSNEGNPESELNKDKKSNTDYTLKSKNVVKLMTDIGIAKDNIYLSDVYTVKPGTGTIGVAIGQKTLSETDGTILVPVAVRGAGYESEWTSNVTIGDGANNKEHAGFADAADQVFAQVQSYITNYDLTDAVNAGKVKFWVTGYSRAGATSNLTAKRLIDAYGDKNEVYGYCMEAPQGAYNESKTNVTSDGTHNYESIHNCINYNDPVPKVAPIGMNFVRYGVDHVFNDPNDSKTSVEVEKAKKQLKMVAPDIAYDDYFHLATAMMIEQQLNWLLCIDSDMIRPVTDSYIKKAAPTNGGTYTDALLERLQSWAVQNREAFAKVDDNHDLRRDTSLSKVSFEQSLQLVMPIVFSKSSAELDELLETATEKANDLSLVGLYKGPIRNWRDYKDNDSEKKTWIWNKLWDVIVEPSDGSGIASKLSTQEVRDLKTAWPTLIDTLLTFVNQDYRNGSDWVVSWDGSTNSATFEDGLNVIASLAYNSTSLLQAHYPEINYAWLRSKDTNYDNESKRINISSSQTPAVNYSLSEGKYSGSQVLKLDTKVNNVDNGAAIYYKLKTTVAGKTSETTWLPYNKQILLPTGTDANGNEVNAEYEVTTKAVLGVKVSETTNKKYTICPDAPVQIKIVDQNGTSVVRDGVTYECEKGGEITIPVQKVTGKFFTKWSSNDITIKEDDVKKQAITIKIRETDTKAEITLTATYQDKINQVEITDLATPVASQDFDKSAQVKLTGKISDESTSVTTINPTAYDVQWIKIDGENESIVKTQKAEYNVNYRAVIVLRPETGVCELADNLGTISVKVNDTQIENPRIEKKDDGSYWVFTNITKTDQSIFVEAPAITVTGQVGTALNDLTVPENILIKATDGYKNTTIKPGTLKCDGYEKDKEGEYSATAEVNLDGTGVKAVEGTTPTVTVNITLKGQPVASMPKLSQDSPAQGRYKDAKAVKFADPADGETIYYKVEEIQNLSDSSEDNTFEAYTKGSEIKLEQPNAHGAITNYRITAYTRSEGKADSTHVSFLYSICNPYRVTINYADTGMGNWSKNPQIETYFPDEYVTIIAPEETAEVFSKWTNTEDVKSIQSFDETDKSIEVGQIEKDITITALYNPIVSNIRLTLKNPSAGEKLPSKVAKCEFTVEKDHDMEKEYNYQIPISEWTPQEESGIAQLNERYVSQISMKLSSEINGKNVIFKVSPDLKMQVVDESGDDLFSIPILLNDQIVVSSLYNRTEKVKAVSVDQLDNITDMPNDTTEAEIREKLPSTIGVKLATGTTVSADVNWALSGFTSGSISEQEVTATGTLTLPTYVDATDIQGADGKVTVTVKAYIKGAEKVKEPVASLQEGLYIGAQKVTLSCATEDATIYYTTDGTIPTTASTPYEDGQEIAINDNTVLTAIAVKNGMQDSSAASYEYTIHIHKDDNQDGKCDGIIKKNQDGTEVTEPCDTVFLGRSNDSTVENPEPVYGKIVKDDEKGTIYVKVDGNDIVEKVDSNEAGENISSQAENVEGSEEDVKEDVALKWKYTNNAEDHSKDVYPTTNLKYSYTPEGSSEATDHGYIFAGWYKMEEKTTTDDNGDNKKETVMTAYDQMPRETAYAKFVDATVLDVKAQIKADTEKTSTETSMRFITTVDGTNYSKVGFKISYNGKEHPYETKTVYKKIYASDKEKENIVASNPKEVCKNNISMYFTSYRFDKIPNEWFDMKFDVISYWVTLDGTMVYGEHVNKAVSDSPDYK